MSDLAPLYERAAAALRSAGALVIGAGAGIGVDSGLPDFRGPQGFWEAYPPYERLGIAFEDAANPVHFEQDPAFGWGFYGHRTHLYRSTTPHDGFTAMLGWIERLGLPAFVVTSNVDGQFQKAGFPADRIVEVHGSIHHLQCCEPCSRTIWRNEEQIPVDVATMRARHVPRCPRCRGVARPNILMFGDWSWISSRTDAQRERFEEFVSEHCSGRVVAVEIGAGTAIPTIRYTCERLGASAESLVVRINPREPQIGGRHIAIPTGAREAIMGIDRALGA